VALTDLALSMKSSYWFVKTHIGIWACDQLLVAFAFPLRGWIADVTLRKSSAVTRLTCR